NPKNDIKWNSKTDRTPHRLRQQAITSITLKRNAFHPLMPKDKTPPFSIHLDPSSNTQNG
ncbi:hypothetical protein CDAR_591961, partial [Caerostris darwini]